MRKDEKDEILHMRLPGGMKRVIDTLRRAEADIPTRSEMVRRLIQRAGDALKKKGKS